MSEPKTSFDALFQTAVAIAQGGYSEEWFRAYYFPFLLDGNEAPASSAQDMADVVEWHVRDPRQNPEGNYRDALRHLLLAYEQAVDPAPLTRPERRAMVLGVHAGMRAEEIWGAFHGSPWPPEDALLTLGALRDPTVAKAIQASHRPLNRPEIVIALGPRSITPPVPAAESQEDGAGV